MWIAMHFSFSPILHLYSLVTDFENQKRSKKRLCTAPLRTDEGIERIITDKREFFKIISLQGIFQVPHFWSYSIR